MIDEFVLDVSNQNPIDSGKLGLAVHARVVGLIAKGTEGASYRDPTYKTHRELAARYGVPFGSFLFLHSGSKGNEAGLYLRYVGPKRGDLEPIIDAEEGGLDAGETIRDMAVRVDRCARFLEARGYRPLLYSDVSFWRRLVAAAPDLHLPRLRVWEAQYPGRFARWFPGLMRLRIRLLHGATVVLWQWTDSYLVGGRGYDCSRLFVPIDDLRIP